MPWPFQEQRAEAVGRRREARPRSSGSYQGGGREPDTFGCLRSRSSGCGNRRALGAMSRKSESRGGPAANPIPTWARACMVSSIEKRVNGDAAAGLFH